MPTPRRPKKAFIQAVVAGGIALVLGGVGIVLLVLMFNAINIGNEGKLAELEKQMEERERQLQEQLEAAKTQQVEAPKTFFEVQAAVEIPIGTPIEERMLKEVEIADGRPTMDSFPRSSNVVGKVANANLLPGEVITKKKLLDTEGMLSVPEGKRAISIVVTNVGMINGALTPGAYVDVLATVGKDDPVTKTLIQNVRVISVGGESPVGRATGATASPLAVTIEVTPDQAEVIALANKEGDFHLALRGFGDKQTAQLYGSDLGQLISGISRAERERSAQAPSEPTLANRPNEIPVNYSENPADLPEPAVPEPVAQSFTMEIYKGATPESKEFEWQY